MKHSIMIIGAVMLLASASVVPAQKSTSGSEASRIVIEKQLSAFRVQSHMEAFSYAAPQLRQYFGTVENFMIMVKRGYNPIYRAKNWTFGRNQIDGQAIHHEVLISGPNDREWVALYSLRRQADGSWKITGVKLLKSKAQST